MPLGFLEFPKHQTHEFVLALIKTRLGNFVFEPDDVLLGVFDGLFDARQLLLFRIRETATARARLDGFFPSRFPPEGFGVLVCALVLDGSFFCLPPAPACTDPTTPMPIAARHIAAIDNMTSRRIEKHRRRGAETPDACVC